MEQYNNESIDTPVQLIYKNGNNFPPNFIVIAYALLAASVLLIVTGSYYTGAGLMLLCLFVVTNQHIVVINVKDNYVYDCSKYLGFINTGKKYPLNRYKYICPMPLIESQRVYARTAQSTTISNSYTAVALFGDRLRGKRIIKRFDSKNEATEVAEKLANHLGLKYFEYDPQLVRDVLTGKRSL